MRLYSSCRQFKTKERVNVPVAVLLAFLLTLNASACVCCKKITKKCEVRLNSVEIIGDDRS